ncbi:right-handed parallel beta-helix repeat-containing protein [Paenibacillus qinlingensis]|uniref:Pectate lyase superfamily protein domain-containing protein n=1 Tax=Paenibacillus qinlingensis TaxID=1837343 RepID=A0ABU1P292_9BACL|nr:right-handed parallel beta-helix repeat-containing protein [Paenibacillus qinlingensis]MDR6553870.1 hypothetical protein [Paenibacillus qinlingensis]
MAVNNTVINVKDYGVKGDGKTNDTATMQAALTSIASLGAIAYIPLGTYLISSTLTTLVSILSNGATLKVSATKFEMMMLNIIGSNIIIEGLNFNGNSIANRGITISANRSNITIRDCEIYSLKQLTGYTTETLGIHIQSGVTHVSIMGCYIHNLDASVTGICRGVLANQAGGTADSTNITITNNRFEEISPINDGDGVVIQDFKGFCYITIANNYFKRCYKRSIKIQVNGTIVTGNLIDNPFLGTSKGQIQPYSAISVYGSYSIVTNNNIVGGTYLCGIEIGSLLDVTTHVITIGNSVKFDAVNADVSGADCIRAYGASDFLTINDNILKDGRYGIRLTSYSNGVTINGNILENMKFPAILLEGTNSSYPKNATINGNSFVACQHYGIDTTKSTSVSSTGNIGVAAFGLINPSCLPNLGIAGTTAQRPTTNLYAGLSYFDTSLGSNGKTIWRNKNNNGWVDATGISV